MIYFTITGVQYCFGNDTFKVGQKVFIEKDPNNKYDAEAIIVTNENDMQLGHVANSVRTVAKGTHSAGWVAHHMQERASAEVLFIMGDSIIAKLVLDS